ECGALDDATARGVGQVADEAANLIGEFDEAFSNRQTWNNAALAAIAGWFEDDELARRAIEGPTGLLAHLMRGFGRDGMWYEGENYHLFALRGLLTGAAWAREAGVDVSAEQQLARRVQAALLAPSRTALPDFTFPARKDSRFGISLAQPAYVELWEVGLGSLGKRETGNGKRELESWLAAVYRAPTPQPELFDSYLHDAPLPRVPFPVSRRTLSWWSLLCMLPELPSDVPVWSPRSVLLESQGLAVLRTDDRYASLECGQLGGGHGHPDRLHLTLHAGGVHWLADPGTGSYVARDLFWYRSTLAHNAPRLDGASQAAGNAVCEAWDARGVRAHGGLIEVDTVQGTHRHTATPGGWEVATDAGRVRLAGGREPEPPFAPLLELDRPTPAIAAALRVTEPPPLDGTLDGFDTSEPLRLELEDQYRRSEEAYSGPEDF